MTDKNISSSHHFFFSELAKIMNNSHTNTDDSNKLHNNIIISSNTISPTGNNNGVGNVSSDEYENYCLITKEKLHPNHITLSCNHKFNYIPIYKEISYQKNKNNTSFEITKLSNNEIKCPYCRRITNMLIPYIPYPSVKQIKYVNSPQELCMPAMKCQHVFRVKSKCNTDNNDDVDDIDNVDNVDNIDNIDNVNDIDDIDDIDNDAAGPAKCNKTGLYYQQENVLFCAQHFRQYEKRIKSIKDKKAKQQAKSQAKSQAKIVKQSLSPHCKAIIKSGKNIDKPCDRIIYVKGASFCKIHS
jgi:hypothetical protein